MTRLLVGRDRDRETERLVSLFFLLFLCANMFITSCRRVSLKIVQSGYPFSKVISVLFRNQLWRQFISDIPGVNTHNQCFISLVFSVYTLSRERVVNAVGRTDMWPVRATASTTNFYYQKHNIGSNSMRGMFIHGKFKQTL